MQFSEVALCDFRAGKNFSAGISLWHTPRDGLMNRQDTIHDNHVRYASYNGIVWAGSENVSILHNQTENNGESGLKNSATRGDGTYDIHVQVIGNQTQHNHYDGLDLSEDYPHRSEHLASSVASGNTSNFNDRTGTYADGLGWTLTDNTFEGNGLSGMSLDVSDSIVSGNILENNNSLHERYSHQMLIGPGAPSKNNLIEHNRIVGSAASGLRFCARRGLPAISSRTMRLQEAQFSILEQLRPNPVETPTATGRIPTNEIVLPRFTDAPTCEVSSKQTQITFEGNAALYPKPDSSFPELVRRILYQSLGKGSVRRDTSRDKLIFQNPLQ